MSTNIRFGTFSCRCAAIRQTPTKVTYRILESDDPMKAYLDWRREELAKQEPHDEDQDPPESGYAEQYSYEVEEIKAYAQDHPNAEWTAR